MRTTPFTGGFFPAGEEEGEAVVVVAVAVGGGEVGGRVLAATLGEPATPPVVGVGEAVVAAAAAAKVG